MPTPEEVLAEFTRMQQEKNKPSAEIPAVTPFDTKAENKEESGTPGIQDNAFVVRDGDDKAVVVDIPTDEALPSLGEVGGRGSIDKPNLGVFGNVPIINQLPGDKGNRPGKDPVNPLEVMPAVDRLPHVPSTGPITPPTTVEDILSNRFDKRARVPEGFMSAVGVILKDSGADSMSQEKALAKINELLEYPRQEPDMRQIPKMGKPATDPIAPLGNSPHKPVDSEVPGNPNPE